MVTDAFRYGPVAPAYDRVLADVPCSGWGVFGRKADLRWQANKNIEELVKLQEKLLIMLQISFVLEEYWSILLALLIQQKMKSR